MGTAANATHREPWNKGAYFSDRGRPNQSDRGRCFSVIVDGLGGAQVLG